MWVNVKAWPLNTALYVQEFYENSPYLIFYTLKNMGLENFNAGAGVPTLNRNHLNGISIVVPSKELQAQFDLQISPIFSQKDSLSKANQALVKSRDMLLNRLISGKLSIASLAIHFPPSMQEAHDDQ